MRPAIAAIALVLALPATAAAQYQCLGDFSGNLDDDANKDAAGLRFGMYPGGTAGQVGPVGLPSAPEDAAKREAALAELRPASKPGATREFVIHLYRHFTADAAMAAEEKEADAAVARYTKLGYLVEFVVRYMPVDEDPAKHVPQYTEFLRDMVRRYQRYSRFVSLQVTNEANFPGSKDTSDGAFAGVKDALIQGVLAVHDERNNKLDADLPEVGFNWFYRMSDNIEYPFWEYLRDAGGPAFVAALDWVGVDAYPGTFFPPSSNAISKRNSMINAFDVLRDCFLPIPEIPDSVPIHVTENGYPTGPNRSYETQQQALEEMIRAVHDARGTYNVTDHRWFNLRDGDTASPNFQQQYGLMRDDYTPKPAFETYEKLVEELARAGTATPVSSAMRVTVKPRRARAGRRTAFRFVVRSRSQAGGPVARARIRFGGKTARTNRRGKARIVKRFAHPGRKRAVVRLRYWRTARAYVRVR